MKKVVEEQFLVWALVAALFATLVIPGVSASSGAAQSPKQVGNDPRLQSKTAPDLDQSIRDAARQGIGNSRQRVIIQLRDLTTPQQQLMLQGASDSARQEFFANVMRTNE